MVPFCALSVVGLRSSENEGQRPTRFRKAPCKVSPARGRRMQGSVRITSNSGMDITNSALLLGGGPFQQQNSSPQQYTVFFYGRTGMCRQEAVVWIITKQGPIAEGRSMPRPCLAQYKRPTATPAAFLAVQFNQVFYCLPVGRLRPSNSNTMVEASLRNPTQPYPTFWAVWQGVEMEELVLPSGE
ncbi:hypothetical protein QOT17_003380 [Balamuthia mandrillaris]